jgi:hypothetical protein
MNSRCKRHALAALVSGPTERGFADEGLRLPDHAVDLAFADALQDATSRPLSPTPAGEEPVRPQEPGRSPFHADQSRVDRFRKQTAAGSGERQEALQGDGYVQYITRASERYARPPVSGSGWIAAPKRRGSGWETCWEICVRGPKVEKTMPGCECEAMEGVASTGFLRVLRVQALLRGLHVSQ